MQIKVARTFYENIFCTHECDLFQYLLLREGLNAVSTPRALHTGIQESSQVHKCHPVEGDLWILYDRLRPHTHIHIK